MSDQQTFFFLKLVHWLLKTKPVSGLLLLRETIRENTVRYSEKVGATSLPVMLYIYDNFLF